MGMWKEAYAVGNQLIDSQHRELFGMADDLVAAVRRKDADSRVACARALAFLKDYVVKHFADEEALQAALGYSGLPEHRKLHSGFVATVLKYEQSLVESDFETKIMQRFAGKLIGWLIYHVVGEDRKITGMVAAAPGLQPLAPAGSAPQRMLTCFADSACEILSQMLGTAVGLGSDQPPQISGKNDISISVGIIGDQPGRAEFVFPLVTALRMVRNMAMVEAEGFGEMVESALREVANIISGNAASRIADTGQACDITTPTMYQGLRPIPNDSKVVKCASLGDLFISFAGGLAG